MLLAACGAPVKQVSFPAIEPFELHYAPLSEVRAACPECSPNMACFFRYKPRQMWVSWENLWCVLHELGHAAGWDEPTVMRIIGRSPSDVR